MKNTRIKYGLSKLANSAQNYVEELMFRALEIFLFSSQLVKVVSLRGFAVLKLLLETLLFNNVLTTSLLFNNCLTAYTFPEETFHLRSTKLAKNLNKPEKKQTNYVYNQLKKIAKMYWDQFVKSREFQFFHKKQIAQIVTLFANWQTVLKTSLRRALLYSEQATMKK